MEFPAAGVITPAMSANWRLCVESVWDLDKLYLTKKKRLSCDMR
jgi:hypothetical protein